MKARYVGQSFGVDSLTDGKIYECMEGEFGFLRVIDDSGEDYLYSPFNPAPLNRSCEGGHWEIVEDDENKTLEKLINPERMYPNPTEP